MKKTVFTLFAAALVSVAGANASFAQNGNMSGMNNTNMSKDSKNMSMSKEMKNMSIAEAAMNNSDLSTLVTAVKAAGLADMLMNNGKYTVFAPTNAAFDKLPAGTVDNLLKPENKMMLTKVLQYHVVAGEMDAKKIMKAIKKGNGTATLTTANGDTLTAKMQGNKVMLMDKKSGMIMVLATDMKVKNGVIHTIDTVAMPS